MLRVFILAATVAVVFAGRSPNADLVEVLNRKGGRHGRYSNNALEDALLDVPGLVTKYGYPIETHTVTTQDGYILTMHRIPHGRDRNNSPDPNKTVVFLMHGLLSSSADFLVLGPGNALGYILAEEGYDVWLGNARGNFYSRAHTSLNPDSRLNQNFWRFSWDEIGNHDLPAFLDYIEGVTGQSKLHYVGHSQGGTSFLVLNSLRPRYNEKFISFQGLAPASFFSYNDQETMRSMAQLESVLEPAAFAMGLAEVFSGNDFLSWFTDSFCDGSTILEPMCGSTSLGDSSVYINETMMIVFRGHSPAGAAIRQFTHYGQSIRFDRFRRFNHNLITNLATYGSRDPPDYNMGLVTAPTYLHYALADTLVHPKDVEQLASRLPNVKVLNLVNSEVFGHVDFIWANHVKSFLYDDMLRMMREAETNAA